MASRKNRNPARANLPVSSPQPALAPYRAGIQPKAPGQADGTIVLLALMIFLTPALGVPHEEMLQDTLKSAVVSLGTLTAGLLFFWRLRHQHVDLHWHGLVLLPLSLCVYALGSMAWSHTYLAAVEAIRWFVFGVLLWLGSNTLTRERVPLLAWGIHCGALVASLWTAFQFWVDFSYFPQGASPASSFFNRNFMAEFVVCTLPFSTLLLARARQSASIALLAMTTGFNLVAVLMSGTRSALLAMLAMGMVLPLILYTYRQQLAFVAWRKGCSALMLTVLLGTVFGLGSIPCGNARILQEHPQSHTQLQGCLTALQRALTRSRSIVQPEKNAQRSFSARLVMWRATGRMILGQPIAGVGAGAWEVALPLYQPPTTQLETDYYAHNEILQLLAEYGLLGWVVMLGLLGYLGKSAWHTLRDHSHEALADAPLRALTLTSLLMLLIVSNAGFPWRLAGTGALFALALALLAASDARLKRRGFTTAMPLALKPVHFKLGAVMMALCLALAAYITQQAAACESRIVRAVKLGLSISLSGDHFNPKWNAAKQEVLALIRQGIHINPHYRKLTPTVAEELARWGNWKDALWIWESLHQSRPNLVALVTNMARGYSELGQNDKAFDYLARAKKLQPGAAAVNSLEVILLSRTGHERQAYIQARALINTEVYDYDLVNAAHVLAVWAKDWPMAVQALQLRIKDWPAQAADGWLKLGSLYASVPEIKDDAKALAAYRQALAIASPADKLGLQSQIPATYLLKTVQNK